MDSQNSDNYKELPQLRKQNKSESGLSEAIKGQLKGLFSNNDSQQESQEIKQGLTENNIVSAFFKSQFLLIITLSILYQTYNLMSDYITVFFFAFITQITLKQYKDEFVQKILQFFRDKKSKLSRSLLNRLISFLMNSLQKPSVGAQRLQQLYSQHFQIYNFTSNIIYITVITLIYALYKNTGFLGIQVSFVVILILDYFIRASYDFFQSILKKIGFKEKFNSLFTIREKVDPLATNFVVLWFMCSMLFIVLIIIGLLGYEIYQFKVKATQGITVLNEQLEEMGVHSYLNEDYLKGLAQEHIDKLDTYIDNSDFKVPIEMIQAITTDILGQKDDEVIIQNENQSKQQSKVDKYIEKCSNQYLEHTQYDFIPEFLNSFLSSGLHGFCYITSYSQYFNIDIKQHAMDFFDSIKEQSLTVFKQINQLIFAAIAEIISIIMVMIDYILLFVVYFVSLQYLLTSEIIQEGTYLKNVIASIPGENSDLLYDHLLKNIKGVFHCTFDIGMYHMIFTWLILDIFGCQFPFLSAIIAGIMAIIPIIPVFLITVPHIIYLYFHTQYTYCFLLFIIYFYISGRVLVDIYENRVNAHPYLIGIAVGFGIYTFGIRGIIYGPLIICIVNGIFLLLSQKKEDSNTNSLLKKTLSQQTEDKNKKNKVPDNSVQAIKEQLISNYTSVLTTASIISIGMYLIF